VTLPIIEDYIYGQMTLETSAWTTPFSWVDRTADVVYGINYSLGGRVGLPGQSQVDVGTLNASFKNLASVPLVGDIVRLRRTGTTEYAFTGYVQDVSQRVVFDDSVSYTTPITVTTINCLDWVGYVSQFQAVGVGGLAVTTFAPQKNYAFGSRARALNNIIDATNATQLITATDTGAATWVGDTDVVGTFSEHLDLVATTQDAYWYGSNVLPTNKTTGRTGLVQIRTRSTAPSSGKTFTDEVGSAGQLHYIDLALESSSQNVANTFVLNNHSRITTIEKEVTKIGGAQLASYAVVNNVEVISADFTATYTMSDATSIATYGNRATEIDTNLAGLVQDVNLVGNPSMEYGDDGWSTGANRMARRKPEDNGTPFAAYDGEWALRYRLASGPANTPSFRYSGSENDGIPIVGGTSYMFQAAGARGANTSSNTRVRAYIEWQNNAGNVISTIYGARTTTTTAYNWYVVGVAGAAPANAERAIVGLEFDRASGSFSAGDQTWLDGAVFRKSSSATPVTYFDGDSDQTTSSLFLWTGELGLSPTFKVNNILDDTISTYLTRYANTDNRITRLRWNAQEDITSVGSMFVGSTIQVIYDGTTTTHRIVGIDGSIDPERYMIDYYLEKV
jgi:hypothetical protein